MSMPRPNTLRAWPGDGRRLAFVPTERGPWESDDFAALVAIKWALARVRATVAPSPALTARAWAGPAALAQAIGGRRLAGLALLGVPQPPLDGASERRLQEVAAAQTMTAIQQVGVAGKIMSALAAEGVRALFVKGPVLSQQVWGEPGMRASSDLDVVVSPADLDRAVAVVRGLGASGGADPWAGQLSARMASLHHARSLLLHGVAIDLHHRLGPDPHLLNPGFDELWREREIVTVGGVELPTLHREDALLHIASHAGQDNWSSLRDVADFVRLAQSTAPGWDFAALHRRARVRRVPGRLRLAIEVARLVVPELPKQGRREQALAALVWRNHRRGRRVRISGRPQDVAIAFLFRVASEGDWESVQWGVRRLLWLPSAASEGVLPDRVSWAYPLASPVLVARRVVQRQRAATEPRRHPRLQRSASLSP